MGPVGRIKVDNMTSIGCPSTLAVDIGPFDGCSPFNFRTLFYCERVLRRSWLSFAVYYFGQFKVPK